MRVFQVMDALDFGDGVSNNVINTHLLLNDIGVENAIYAKWWDEKVEQYVTNINKLKVIKDDVIIFHFSGKSFIIDTIMNLPCQRVLCYHNVTPADFFKDTNPQAYHNCKEGILQLEESIQNFHYFIADSQFNQGDLLSYGVSVNRVDVLPIVMNLERLDLIPCNKVILKKYENVPNILFVGRVAPNKRFEVILDIFENLYCYRRQDVHLTLVGNIDQDNAYAAMLMEKLSNLNCKDNVAFTGKVPSEDLYAYYKSADIFLCMSEHEGFCIPLIEAMYFQIPVIAYDSSAVPHTMGGKGVLLHRKDIPTISALLNYILNDASIANRIISEQNKNVDIYRTFAIQERLQALLKKWSVKDV